MATSVPRGVFPLSWNLDHAGPMARRVRDVALILQTIAGYDSLDPYSVDAPVPDYITPIGQGVRGLRVVFANRGHFAQAEPEVMAAVGQAARLFERLGASVSEGEIEIAQDSWRANGLMTTSDGAAYHRERLKTRPDDFGDDVRARLMSGANATSAEYALARRTQSLARRWFEDFFKTCDILLTPTTPAVAPLRASSDAVETARLLTRFTAPFNLSGLPALSVPCGFSQTGMPIGLQIVSRHWAEATVFRAGIAYEQATDWHNARPKIA